MVSKPICRHCVAGVQLFKQCRKLSAGTVLQGCSCLSSVPTYLLALCCRGAGCLSGVATFLPALCCRGEAVKAVWKPICRHCVAGVQLLKRCQNLSAGTVLEGCSCLSSVATYLPALCSRAAGCLCGVKTYLPALCCRGATV